MEIPADGVLTLALREGSDVFRARLPPAGGGEASLEHNRHAAGLVDETAGFGGVAAGARILMWNVDNGVRLLVDGELLLRYDYTANRPRIPDTELRNEPYIEVADGAVLLRRVTVLRDVHYTAQGVYGTNPDAGLTPCRVPPDGLFLLGDASAASRDSRAGK